MGNSISQQHVPEIPNNEVVHLLICGHGGICLRVGFKNWNLILILCSIVIGTIYVMGSDEDELVEDLRSKLQASDGYIKELIQKMKVKDATILNKQQSINELTTSLRRGITGPFGDRESRSETKISSKVKLQANCVSRSVGCSRQKCS